MFQLLYRNKIVIISVALFEVLALSGLADFSVLFIGRLEAAEVQKTKAVTVAVVDIGGKTGDESVRKNIVRTVREGFRSLASYKPLGEEKIREYFIKRQNIDAGPGREGLRKAFKLLRDGKKAYERMDKKEAIERLTAAKKEFIGALNELKSNEKLLEAYLYLGMALAAAGKRKSAYAEFKKVLYLDDKKHLSPKEYSPDVIKLFERAKRDMAMLPKGTLLVDSVPSDCTVYVNAKDIGPTPVNALYPIGEYYIKIEKEGYLPWYQLVSVEDRINTVEVELMPLAADDELVISLKPVPENVMPDPYTVEVLKDIKDKLGVDIIFLGWIERSIRDMIAGQLYDARSGVFSDIVQSSLGKNFSNVDFGVKKLIEDLSMQVDEKGFVLATEKKKDEPQGLIPPTKMPSPAELRKRKSEQWYNKWWVWALVGGIAAGAGVGIYYGVSGGSSGGITVINKGNF